MESVREAVRGWAQEAKENAGWLVAAEVAALEVAVGDRVRGTRLELAELRSADAAAALRGLEARGARLHGAAPSLRLLLGAGAGGDDASGADHG